MSLIRVDHSKHGHTTDWTLHLIFLVEEFTHLGVAAIDLLRPLLNREKNTPAMLSTGEQQRVGIARALVARPALLIADEPTGNLDPDLSLDIMKLFSRFNEVGVTMLIATHDLGLVKQLGGRRIVLENGTIQTTP